VTFPRRRDTSVRHFHFFPVTETSHSPIISHSRNNSVQHLFRLSSPSFAATPFAATFPVAETPIVSNFPSVSPMLKHHCSDFHPFPSSFSPPSSTKQFRPQLFRLFCAETPLFSISHPFPIIFFTPLIDETIPSSNCFASLLKHHHSAPHSSIMLKHPPSAPSDSFPILKHQLSAVLHRNFSIFLCCCNTRSPPTVK
jgi:hypothetical protein